MTTIQRDHIIQLMGRHCNELTSAVGLATFADIVDMEGQRHTPEQVAAIFKKNRAKGKTSNFMIMQERKIGDEVASMIENANYLKAVMAAANDNTIRMTTLGFLQRGATPTCRDRWLAIKYGRAAVDCISENKFGVGLTKVGSVVKLYELELAPIP
jgi:6-phosphofructokinase 1